MKFKATRNWFLLAFAVGSPYYWIQYLLANQNDRMAVALSSAFLVFAVVLLVFLLRQHFIEVRTDEIIVKTPFRTKVWTPSEMSLVSVSQDVISAQDSHGQIHHLMIPQKPKEFQELKQAVLQFCRKHKVPLTDQPFDLRRRHTNP